MPLLNVSLFPSNGGRNDIVHHPREQWHSCMKNADLNGKWKIPVNGKIPLDGH